MMQTNRRQLLQGAAALGLASATFPAALRAAPQRGGTLRVGMGHGSTTDTLDPASWNNFFLQAFGFARLNCLTEIAADGSLVGELAESWEASADAKTWVFNIRQGLEFHNGKSLTVDDIITSINHHRGEETKSAAKPIVEGIAEMTKDGPDKLVVTLTEGNADFPFVLADFHLTIHPEKDGAIDFSEGIGTGGYILESFEPGISARLRRNANYWKPDRAWFDEVELLSVKDPSARASAITGGKADVIDKVDLKTVDLLANNPDVTILETSGTQHYSFAMDTRAAPYSDNNVRLALKHAIDRQEVLDKVLHGHGVLGNDHPIARSNRYYADELEQRHYDPDMAKHYLKQAGLSALEVGLHAADAAFAGAVDAAVLYSEHARPAGITINVMRAPNDGYWSNIWMKKPWVAVYWGGRPTEDWMFTTTYAAGAPWNDTFWEHERFNKLLVEARAELDEAKRREMYVEMQRIVRDEGGAVIPMFANYVSAHVNKVAHGEDVATNWDLDGMRLCERWWFT